MPEGGVREAFGAVIIFSRNFVFCHFNLTYPPAKGLILAGESRKSIRCEGTVPRIVSRYTRRLLSLSFLLASDQICTNKRGDNFFG